jgi:hypothetical protein
MTQRKTVSLWMACLSVGVSHPCWSADPPATRPAATVRVRMEARTFDLRPVPPPVPALLYQLAFDPADRRPGSGAAEYLQAALLLTDAEQKLVDQADDANSAGDMKAFDKAAAALSADARVATIFDLLDDAGRCESGGLDAAWRDVGVDALLPQLNPMRGLANLLRVRGRQQARAGDVAGAIDTVRLTYQLARAVGDGGPLICGLVGVGIAAIGDTELSTVMDLRDAPNLYWALSTVPGPIVWFRRSMEAERRFQARRMPVLAGARTADAQPGDLDVMLNVTENAHRGPGHARPTTSPSPMMLVAAKMFVATHPEVTAYYARRHGVGTEAAAKADPAVLYATYVVGRFQDGSDDIHKLLGQPYPLLIPLMNRLAAADEKEGLSNFNMFAILAPSLTRPIEGYAQGDRTRAALTAVEALRSYAAAHDGHLPAALADVTDTPVPDNPVTGRPFEYRLANGTATLGDHDPLLADRPLEYTIRIRKP